MDGLRIIFIFAPMKQSLPISLLIIAAFCSLFCSCTSEGERQHMAQIIAEADSLNRNYIPLTSDSLLLEACQYYDRFGSPNERMKAHYLLGCVYRDMGEAPRALECYYHALEQADTLDADFDNIQARAIFGQMAGVFHSQLLPNKELEAWKQYAQLAKNANDTFGFTLAQEQFIRPYYLLGKMDSVLQITEQVHQQYEQIGRPQQAVAAYPTAIYIYLSRGNVEKAKALMDDFEIKSGLFDTEGHIASGRENYYYSKGTYYLLIHRSDSAIIQFRKLLACHNEKDAYKGLLNAYRQLGVSDSIAKYSLLYEDAIDQYNMRIQTEATFQISAIYNYSRNERIALEKENEAREARMWQYLIAAISLICIVVFIRLYHNYKRRKKEEIRKINDRLLSVITKYDDAIHELEELKEKNYEALILQKEQVIDELKKSIADIHLRSQQQSADRYQEFEQSKIVQLFRDKSVYKLGRKEPKESEWRQLCHEFCKRMPNTYAMFNQNKALSTLELRVCVLLLLDFSDNSCLVLLGNSAQAISAAKKHANLKIFNSDSATTLKSNLLLLTKAN